jgi:hypothetical protein
MCGADPHLPNKALGTSAIVIERLEVVGEHLQV